MLVGPVSNAGHYSYFYLDAMGRKFRLQALAGGGKLMAYA